MNKREKKKRSKIIAERLLYFNKQLIYGGRRNGKWYMQERILKAVFSKSYKYFKELKKEFGQTIIAIDWSNGKDYSVKTTVRRTADKVEILKVEVI